MPFQRYWDAELQAYVPNRSATGPPKPSAETGTVTAEDGSVVSSSATINITPATPIHVNLPSPNEPIVMADGRINHHWWRFFNELYLRTGGVLDNINRTPREVVGSGTTVALITTGQAPTIGIAEVVVAVTGTLSLTGQSEQPALSSPVEAPSTGSISITGQAPTIP